MKYGDEMFDINYLNQLDEASKAQEAFENMNKKKTFWTKLKELFI